MSTSLFTQRGVLSVPAISAGNTNELVSPKRGIIDMSWTGEDFRANLLDMEEEPQGPITLRLLELRVEARDDVWRVGARTTPGAYAGVGGDASLITVGQFVHAIVGADRSFWYVAYVRDTQKRVRGVRGGWMQGAGWGAGQLHIESGPFNRTSQWAVGSVFLAP